MSGSGGQKKKATRSQGWEEAGSEFYQENYSMDAESVEYLHKDPKHIATLLPSKQSRTAATMKNGKNGTNFRTMRKTSTRSRRDSTVHGRGASTTIGGDVSIAMLPDLSQNLSNEETTWEEIMEIKAMPVPMAQKKEYKDKILMQPNLRLQGYEQFKWKRRKAWRQFKTRLNETYEKMKLWRRDLKHIEGYFGTGVLAYFLLIKWLFYLNLFIFTLIFLFVTLPTILLVQESDYDCAQNNSNSDCCSEIYFNSSFDSTNNIFLDLVQGTGTLERTALFYGYYPNKTFEFFIDDSRAVYYNLPLAYVSVCLVYFIVSLYAIVRAAATGIKQRLIESEGQFYQFCNIIFGGWDFCIHNLKSAKIKQKAIYNELKVLLESGKLEEERRSRNRNDYCKIVIKRYLVHFICLCILILCSAGIYFVFDYSTTSLKSVVDNEDFTAKLTQLYYEFLPSIIIVCLNVIIPILFKFFLRFENYSPVYAIKITLIRTVLLRLFSLIVLYASLKSKITCENDLINSDNEKNCQNSKCTNVPVCWETYVGQQIYKLLLTDFAIHFFLTFFVNSLRAILARNFKHTFCQFIGEQTFDLPKNVLDIVYIQTLCWFGYFYAPLLSALASVAFFLLFYIKKFACLHNSKPSAIIYRASRSKSIFMLVLLVCFVFAVLPVAYSIFEIIPSKSCGPFHDLPAVWDLVVGTLMDTPEWIRNVGFFISTAGFVIPVLIILLLLLYYYSAVNSANRHMVTVLKNQLVLEGHDKQFLLDRLSLFIKQENQKRQRYAENMRDGDRNISST